LKKKTKMRTARNSGTILATVTTLLMKVAS